MNIIRRILAPTAIGILATFAYAMVNFFQFNVGVIRINEFYGEQFFSVLSTLYAIITALVLVKGIESFDSLGAAVNREALKLRSVNTYFSYFKADQQKDRGDSIHTIRNLLINYASNVLDQSTAARSKKNDGIIDLCVRHCADITVHDHNDEIALAEIMRGLDKLRQLRADRASLACEKVPGYLIGMLALMTVSIMIPFYLYHDTGFNFNYYIIFTLATFGSFIFFLLTDINKPYEGLWKIDLGVFREAKDELERSATSL